MIFSVGSFHPFSDGTSEKIKPKTCGIYTLSAILGGAITILKNMKVNGKDDIPYIMEK